jgi:ATP-dependent Lon protease
LVLPVGGIKEKMLAAHRAGIRRVIIPKANEKDLAELPESVRREVEFTLAERIETVLAAAIPELASRLAEITVAYKSPIETPPQEPSLTDILHL